MTTEKTQDERLAEVGAAAFASIAEMVAALNCDYDRLQELRDERDEWVLNDGGDEDEQNRTAEEWVKEFPDEAEELAELEAAAGDCEDRDEAEQRIQEDPLSLEFRSGWTVAGHDLQKEEFRLLLSTGGPAVQIVGELDGDEVIRAYLQVQDWFTPWTDYACDSDTLLDYCRVFYMGE